MKCALITAGGCGTRLYPLSTKERPKQFVKMFGDKSLIELTYDRITKFINKENIFIVLPEKYHHFINELLPDVDEENIIIEPEQRSTAPCVLYSCLYIKKIRNYAPLFVFPADHYIMDTNKFINTLNDVYNYILNNNNRLVLLGIKPNKPQDRYGYLKCARSNNNIIKISKFKEKPNKFKAIMYYLSNRYYWSSDIYGFNIDYMINLYKNLLPNDYSLLTNNDIDINEAYKKCSNVSVAYAIFENVKDIYMIKCNFHWDDVGVFESLLKYTNNKNVIDAYNEKIKSEEINDLIKITQ